MVLPVDRFAAAPVSCFGARRTKPIRTAQNHLPTLRQLTAVSVAFVAYGMAGYRPWDKGKPLSPRPPFYEWFDYLLPWHAAFIRAYIRSGPEAGNVIPALPWHQPLGSEIRSAARPLDRRHMSGTCTAGTVRRRRELGRLRPCMTTNDERRRFRWGRALPRCILVGMALLGKKWQLRRANQGRRLDAGFWFSWSGSAGRAGKRHLHDI